MFRSFIDRLRHSLIAAPRLHLDADHHDLARAIHALDVRLSELRRELEAQGRERGPEIRAPGVAGY